jgi:hypothetical protein
VLPIGTGAVIKPAEPVDVVKLLPAPDLIITTDLVRPQVRWSTLKAGRRRRLPGQVSGPTSLTKSSATSSTATRPMPMRPSPTCPVPVGPPAVAVRGIDGVWRGFTSVNARVVVRDDTWRVTYSTLSVLDGRTVEPDGRCTTTAP